jgi:CRP-like cAMP-binding protein
MGDGMNDVLRQCPLFAGIDDAHLARIASLGSRRDLAPGERLFELGGQADRVYVVLAGTVELCLPLSIQGSIKEIAMESQGVGSALGWSAFVKPFRFRLSARAAGSATVVGFERRAMVALIEEDPSFGCDFLARIAEMISRRLLLVQALWARELQRTIVEGLMAPHERTKET